MPQASIDIGSNSLVFLVTDGDGKTLHDESVIAGLGSGLGDRGQFAEGPMQTALAAFSSFAQTADTFGVPPASVHAIATSAARRASNAERFFDRVEHVTGIRVRIIDGLEEARLTWIGALSSLPIHATRLAVVDLGGGSTEIVLGSRTGGTGLAQQSLEMGTVRLMERFGIAKADAYEAGPLAEMVSHIQTLVDRVNWSNPPDVVVAVAGTATTIGAMQLGLRSWDRDAVHGLRLTQTELTAWYQRLASSTRTQRLEWAEVSPQRADLLVAGTAVLSAVAEAAGVDHLVISDGGIRHGVLVDARLQNTQG